MQPISHTVEGYREAAADMLLSRNERVYRDLTAYLASGTAVDEMLGDLWPYATAEDMEPGDLKMARQALIESMVGDKLPVARAAITDALDALARLNDEANRATDGGSARWFLSYHKPAVLTIQMCLRAATESLRSDVA